MNVYYYLFMNGKLRLFLAILSVYPLTVQSQGIDSVISSLKNVDDFKAQVDYSVLMSLQDDVNYRLDLQQWKAAGDTLSPCDYLVEWKSVDNENAPHGFAAYFDGNLYNFRGDRLIEYHYELDPAVFSSRGKGPAALPGIQRRMQFAEFLPAFLAEQLSEIAQNPDCTYRLTADTIIGGQKCVSIEGRLVMSGETLKEFRFHIDPVTGNPISVSFENNPGALAEQSITATYTYPEDSGRYIDGKLSEETLRERYPDTFDRFRESSFAIEKLPGQRMPAFALPTTKGERVVHLLGDKFRSPTLIAILDPQGGFTAPTVESLRGAVDTLPFNAEIIWAFVSNNIDEIEEIIPSPRIGEQTLMSAKPLARDCGASLLPVIIYCGADGVVSDIAVGYNKELGSVVIQKATVAAQQK